MSGPQKDARSAGMLVDPPGPFAPCKSHLEFVRRNLDADSRHHPQLRPHLRESLLLLRLFKRHGGDHHKVLADWSARQPPRIDFQTALDALLNNDESDD